MNKKNILITTSSKAYKNIGGPGKFSPLLFEKIRKNNTNYNVSALLNFHLIKDNEEVQYEINNDKEINVKNKKIKYFKKYIKSIIFNFVEKNRDKRKIDILYNLLIDNKINIIHSHDFYMTYLFTKLREKYKLNVKIIFTNHYKGSLYEEYTKFQDSMFLKENVKKYYKSLEEQAILHCDIITFPSKGAMNLLIADYPDLSKIIKKKTKIIYTGIDEVKKINVEKKNNEILILNVANHIPAKGIIDTLPIVKELNELLNKSGFKLKFVNCGAFDKCTDELMHYIKLNNLENIIKLNGLTTSQDIKILLNKADLFMLTPNITVFDLVLLESMSVGVPIFTTSLEGNKEMLGDNYPLYAKNNNNENVKLIYDFLMDNTNLKNDISNYLMNRYKSLFTNETMIKEYNDLYNYFS